MGVGLKVPAIYPSTGSVLLVRPSLHRVAWNDFPGFTGTTTDSDSSTFFQSPSVDLGDRTHAELLRSLRAWVQLRPARSLVLGHRVTAPEFCIGKIEVSQVPGEPFMYTCPALGP